MHHYLLAEFAFEALDSVLIVPQPPACRCARVCCRFELASTPQHLTLSQLHCAASHDTSAAE